MLGGRLGTYVAARLAVAGCLLAAALVSLLPAQVDSGGDAPKEKNDAPATSSGDGDAPWRARATAAVSATWPLLCVKLVAAVVNSSVGSVRPLVLKNDFGVTEAELG